MATVKNLGGGNQEWLVYDNDYLGTVHLHDGEYHAKRNRHFLGSHQGLADAVEAIIAYSTGD